MHRKTPMLFAGILLATVACSGVDSVGNGIDATDITASAYRLSSGQTLHVSPENATVAVGGTIKLSTIVSSSTGQTISANGNLSAKWMSSDTTIARVSGSGSVVGVRNGVATITASASGQTSAANVTVGTGASDPGATTTTQPVTGSSTTSTSTTTPTTTTTSTPTTPTTPTTTTSTSTTSTSTTSASSQTSFSNAFLYDDFTKYHSTADLQANISTNIGGTGSPATSLYTDGHNPQLASLDQSVTYNGHASMRYDQPAGNGMTPQLWVDFKNGQTLRSFWMRVKIRYSPGWTTTGTLTNCANSYKLLHWGWAGGINGRGGLTITNTTEYETYFYILQNGSLTTPDNTQSAGQVGNEWAGTQWYDYIIQFQETSSTTGVERVWIAPDGQTPVLRSTTQTSSGGTSWPAVERITLGENFNQNRVNAQSLWIGEWSLYDGSQYANPYNVH